MTRAPSADLRDARLALDDIDGVELREDLNWHADTAQWSILIRITAGATSSFVPATSDWYVLVDDGYPRGRIDIHPASNGGLTATFPHQLLNFTPSGSLWRTGKLCVDHPGFKDARWGNPIEPTTAAERLPWHIRRARQWVLAAAQDTLLAVGDRYELPVIVPLGSTAILFTEAPGDLPTWNGSPERCGWVGFRTVGSNEKVVTEWHTFKERPVREIRWGERFSTSTRTQRGVWILVDKPPIVPPFQWPLTWGDLFNTSSEVSVLLREVCSHIRTGKSYDLLIGFPIEARIGDGPHEIHWAATSLAPLVLRKTRDVEEVFWRRDRARSLSDALPMKWTKTENWHADRIGTRGRLRAELRALRVVILGAGALGSMVAELLLRGGVFDITVIDGDTLAVGNLVRHTLTLDEVGQPKAEGLANRLNHISPHSRVRFSNTALSMTTGTAAATLAPFDAIVDCTANDDVIRVLGDLEFGEPKLFASAAVGHEAKRLYWFEARAARFPSASFWSSYSPWLELERMARSGEESWEGAGCWHPLFPAQETDLILMAAMAVKRLETAATADIEEDGRMIVYEQRADLSGLALVGNER